MSTAAAGSSPGSGDLHQAVTIFTSWRRSSAGDDDLQQAATVFSRRRRSSPDGDDFLQEATFSSGPVESIRQVYSTQPRSSLMVLFRASKIKCARDLAESLYWKALKRDRVTQLSKAKKKRTRHKTKENTFFRRFFSFSYFNNQRSHSPLAQVLNTF